MPKPRDWLNRSVLGIAIASFCSDIGHEMATAAFPVLLAGFGASSTILGFIEGFADLLASFAKLLSGHYSDRLVRRKPLAVAGYFLTAAGIGSFSLATQWTHLLFGRAIAWLGRGARTPVRNVLMTEATEPGTRGRAFGFERAMDTAGAVLGPILAILLIHRIGIRSLLALTLVPGFLAALCIWVLVEERPHPASSRPSLFSGLGSLSPSYKKFLFAVGIAGAGDYSKTLLILWATEAWSPGLGPTEAARQAMMCYVAFNVLAMVTSSFSGYAADRFSPHRVLTFGYGFAVLPALVLLLPADATLRFLSAFLLSGIFMGIWETVESAAAAELLAQEERGIGFGALATVNGLADFVSSVLVGTLWTVSPQVAMSMVIVCSVVGAALVWRSTSDALPHKA
ncbi:MAG: MFS transporter [Bdellovibrionota bacterium]